MCVGKWATTATERCKQRVCLRGQGKRKGCGCLPSPAASCCCYAHTVAFCYCFLLIVKWVWRASVKRFFSSLFSLVVFFSFLLPFSAMGRWLRIRRLWRAIKSDHSWSVKRGSREGRCIKEIRKINKSTRQAALVCKILSNKIVTIMNYFTIYILNIATTLWLLVLGIQRVKRFSC